MNSKLTLYEELELLPPNSLRPTVSTRLARRLSYLMGQLLRALVASNEPRITQTGYSQTGEPRFAGYDPISHRRIQGASEMELRIWLEQRYQDTQRVSRTDPRLGLEPRYW